MLDYLAVKNWDFGEIEHAYSERDTMLYALGCGFGSDPLDAGQLRFVFEPGLQSVPSMAAVLGTPGLWWRDERTGANWVKLVHGEQDVRLFGPLPVKGTVMAKNRVITLADKGQGKGAIAEILREIFDRESGELIAHAKQTAFLRGDGGFSARTGIADPVPAGLPAIDERAPDLELALTSVAQTALIYRLSGDYNPLHADPEVAGAAGFDRPILHGLCTYGMATHALLRAYCDYQPQRLQRLAVRFTSPVYPGETVTFQIWEDGPRRLRLRARVAARDVTVLNNGIAELN